MESGLILQPDLDGGCGGQGFPQTLWPQHSQEDAQYICMSNAAVKGVGKIGGSSALQAFIYSRCRADLGESAKF